MVKIYYAEELLSCNYSKQIESKLFHKMYLKECVRLGLENVCIYERALTVLLLIFCLACLCFPMSVADFFVEGHFPSVCVGNAKQNVAANSVKSDLEPQNSGRVLGPFYDGAG